MNRIDTQFISSENSLADVNRKEDCLINIYNEEMIEPESVPTLARESDFGVVFNRGSLKEVIGDKTKTNGALSSRGIRVPRVLDNAIADRRVFSNDNRASGADVQVIDKSSDLNHSRYNTEFIDTLREYEGEKYFTTVRCMCVGQELIHAYVRVRPMTEQSPSVHAKNTPLYPPLINHLQEVLVTDRWNELLEMCGHISDVLGLGFFCHDLLICNKTNDIFVSEVGFKFNDSHYTDRIQPIAAHLKHHLFMFTAEYPARAARAFIRECQRNGCFLQASERGGT